MSVAVIFALAHDSCPKHRTLQIAVAVVGHLTVLLPANDSFPFAIMVNAEDVDASMFNFVVDSVEADTMQLWLSGHLMLRLLHECGE